MRLVASLSAAGKKKASEESFLGHPAYGGAQPRAWWPAATTGAVVSQARRRRGRGLRPFFHQLVSTRPGAFGLPGVTPQRIRREAEPVRFNWPPLRRFSVVWASPDSLASSRAQRAPLAAGNGPRLACCRAWRGARADSVEPCWKATPKQGLASMHGRGLRHPGRGY